MSLFDIHGSSDPAAGYAHAVMSLQSMAEYSMSTNPCSLNIDQRCPPDVDDVCTASGITKAAAAAACANVVPCNNPKTNVVDDCTYDVCLTGDVGVSESYETGNPIACEIQRPESSTLCGTTTDPNVGLATSKAAMEANGWSFDWDTSQVGIGTALTSLAA